MIFELWVALSAWNSCNLVIRLFFLCFCVPRLSFYTFFQFQLERAEVRTLHPRLQLWQRLHMQKNLWCPSPSLSPQTWWTLEKMFWAWNLERETRFYAKAPPWSSLILTRIFSSSDFWWSYRENWIRYSYFNLWLWPPPAPLLLKFWLSSILWVPGMKPGVIREGRSLLQLRKIEITTTSSDVRRFLCM